MDIDIDFPTNFDPLDIFENAVRASMLQKGELRKHTCGAYLQSMPQDPVTKLAAIPYDKAEQYGYFKIDFLHLNILDHFSSKNELRRLLDVEPDWTLLQSPDVIPKLFQLAKWGMVLELVKPTSVEELADCLALIRPKKQYLMHTYQKGITRGELFNIERGDKSSFKRGHAISYALVIVLQLHLIKDGIL